MTENMLKDKHILLADDNPINREMVKIILENFDLTVTTAENGRQVLSLLSDSSYEFDLVILDINMPELNGIETAAEIRNSTISKIKSIPIIALTSNESSNEVNSIFRAGINSYIAKPASPEALIKVVEDSIINPNYSNRNSQEPGSRDLISDQDLDHSKEQEEIDIEKGIFYVGNDFNIFKKLLLRFYKNYTGYVEKIKEFVENGEIKNLKFAIHNLKGVSAQICAHNLNKEARDIENRLKEDPASVNKEKIDVLEAYFIKTMAAIEVILSSELNQIPEMQNHLDQKISPQILKKNLLMLATALKQKKIIDAEQIIKDIGKSALNENHRKVLNEIKIFAKNFDFESALLRVKTFLKLL
ncbi:MAG: response regulator [Desulfobacteraceae bacterium]|nr:response regulator [Desulfobacteraceae bacterium]